MRKLSNLNEQFDTLSQTERKFILLIGGRVKNKTRIRKVCKKIDAIRKKLSKKLSNWDTTAEIRKWRETRCIS
jgi:hypothetical protein